MDIKNTEGYKSWLKKRRKRFFCCSIIVVLLEIIIICLLSLKYSHVQLSLNLLFGVGVLILFLLTALYYLHKLYETYTYSIVYVKQGIVLKKKRFRAKDSSKQYDKRAYYIDVLVDEQIVECVCEYENYLQLTENNNVIVFQIDNDKKYYVIPY